MSTQPRVCSFESRRSDDMRSLIERHGGTGTVVASMQEVPLEDNTAVVEFANQLRDGAIGYVVFMTGVGARTLQDALSATDQFEPFLAALKQTKVIARGPKPTVVLREWGVGEFHTVAQPNTWRELVELLDDKPFDLSGATIAVQEYGIPNTELYAAIETRGAVVYPVPVYRWKLPDDTAPLAGAIAQTIAGDFDILMFTSANQARNVLTVASENGHRDAFVKAAWDCLVASIGPTCTETLVAEGFEVGYESSPPKMGQLVRGAIQQFEAQT